MSGSGSGGRFALPARAARASGRGPGVVATGDEPEAVTAGAAVATGTAVAGAPSGSVVAEAEDPAAETGRAADTASATTGSTRAAGAAIEVRGVPVGAASAHTAGSCGAALATVATVREEPTVGGAALAAVAAVTAADTAVFAVPKTVAVVDGPVSVAARGTGEADAALPAVTGDAEEPAVGVATVTAGACGLPIGRCASGATPAASAHERSALAAVAAVETGPACTALAAVAEPSGVTAVAAGHPVGCSVEAVAAVTEPQTAVGAVGVLQGSVGAVADQILPRDLVDHTVDGTAEWAGDPELGAFMQGLVDELVDELGRIGDPGCHGRSSEGRRHQGVPVGGRVVGGCVRGLPSSPGHYGPDRRHVGWFCRGVGGQEGAQRDCRQQSGDRVDRRGGCRGRCRGGERRGALRGACRGAGQEAFGRRGVLSFVPAGMRESFRHAAGDLA
ncbi:hypothetical protein BN975_02403 [Mycolicibacterium farcinogenes]|nr:hypothetical protein BN975_02403 [Mycolicibacterium farcinogenes]